MRFEGFQGGLPAGWTRTGTWAAAACRAAATSGANSEDRLLVGASLGTRDWIGARVTIDRIHGTSARTARGRRFSGSAAPTVAISVAAPSCSTGSLWNRYLVSAGSTFSCFACAKSRIAWRIASTFPAPFTVASNAAKASSAFLAACAASSAAVGGAAALGGSSA